MTTLRTALEALVPPDNLIDSTGDYEMLEVCYRFEGYRWREFRAALATPPAPEPSAALVAVHGTCNIPGCGCGWPER